MSFETNHPADSDMRSVGILVFDGVTLLDVAGPAEVFSRAVAAARTRASGHRHYQVLYLSSAGGSVVTSSGLTLSGTMPVADSPALDLLLVPGADDLPHRPYDPTLLDAVRRASERARLVASVCTGAFLLAELGLLDGRRVTTHWKDADLLASRYPSLDVDRDVIHAQDGRFLTSAGVSTGIDLALHLVELDFGADMTRDIARDVVVYMQRPGGQSQFSAALRHPSAHADRLRAVTEHVQSDPAHHTLTTMADLASVSPRHLTRLFRDALGTTPARWLEEVRLDQACRLILDGHTVTDSARASGFGTDENLRRAFARNLGCTPSQYRSRFSTTNRSAVVGD